MLAKMAQKVHLASPIGVLVYDVDGVLYNAGDLSPIRDTVTDKKPVDGFVTTRFGTSPLVVEYASGDLEVLYTVNGSMVTSSGRRVSKPPSPVVRYAVIQTMDRVPLRQVDECVLDKYITRPNLEIQLDALCRRIYGLDPAKTPESLEYCGREYPVVDYADIKPKIAAGQIKNIDLVPVYQAFAGSPTSSTRLLTLTDTEGKVCHVKAAYK